jgi:predicted nucleotidyltransferase
MKANKIREYKFEDLLKNKMKNKLFREEYENLEKVDFNKDIQLIKEAILNNIEVKYIYLFGSYAYGKPN